MKFDPSFILEQMTDAVLVADGEGRMVYVNEQACLRLGYTREELLRLRVADIEAALPDNFSYQEHLAFLKEKGEHSTIGLHRKKDGSALQIRISVKYAEKEGEPYLIGVARPIEEEEKADLFLEELLKAREKEITRREEELEKHKELFRTVIDESPYVIHMKDEEGRFLLANKTLADLYNTTPEAMVGKTDADFNPNPEQAEQFRDSIKKVLSDFKTRTFLESSTDVATGEVRYFQSVKKPMKDKEGHSQVLVIAIDITELKQAQSELEELNRNLEERVRRRTRQLEESARWLEEAQELARMGYWELDIPTGKMTASGQLYKIYGQSPEQFRLTMDNALQLIHPEDKRSLLRMVQNLRKEDAPQTLVHRIIRPGGEVRTLQTRVRLVRSKAGIPIKIQGTEQDVTDQAELETKQRRQEQMLVHQSRMAAMGEMINAIAHQWRQPLNALGITVQDVADAYDHGELDEAYIRRNVKRAMDQIHYMSRTINDFRRFFKPAREKQLFDVQESVRGVLKLLDAQLSHREIRYEIRENCSNGCPYRVSGFRNEFEQVVVNLINNARDAIEERMEKGALQKGEGFIRTSVSCDGKEIRVVIADNGGGVPPKAAERIFDPYFTTKDEDKGTGIGLYMAKNIIEKNMHGRMDFENRDEGAAFSIHLSLHLEEE